LEKLLINPTQTLLENNMSFIIWMGGILKINTPLLRSSEMGVSGENAVLLANICSKLGATEYLSPPGSRTYLDDSDAFSKLCIPIKYFNFECLPYTQQYGEFVPYLSTLDLLLNCGKAGVDIINKGAFK
jgi:hypothetical protein